MAPIDAAKRKTYALPDSAYGLVITSVKAGSDADTSGLTPGLVVASANEQTVVATLADALQAVVDAARKAGRPAVLLRVIDPAGGRAVYRRQVRPASRIGDPIEHMRAQDVARREARVVEVVGRVAAHADFFHDALARQIDGGGEGDHLIEVERFPCIVKPGEGAFRGEALAPDFLVQLPADLDTQGGRA